MKNEFALELARGIEELCLEKGLSREMLVKQAITILERQAKDIDILKSIRETEIKLYTAGIRFNNAEDIADIEEAIMEITEHEVRLSALRKIAMKEGVRSNEIQLAGFAKR